MGIVQAQSYSEATTMTLKAAMASTSTDATGGLRGLLSNWEFDVWIIYILLLALAVGISFWALWLSIKANRLGEDSNAKADKANQLACDANKIADKALREQQDAKTIAQKALDISERALETQSERDRRLRREKLTQEQKVFSHITSQLEKRIADVTKNRGTFSSPGLDKFGDQLSEFVRDAKIENPGLRTSLLSVFKTHLSINVAHGESGELQKIYTVVLHEVKQAFQYHGEGGQDAGGAEGA